MEVSEKIEAIQMEPAQTTQSMGEASTEVTKAREFIQKVGNSFGRNDNIVCNIRVKSVGEYPTTGTRRGS